MNLVAFVRCLLGGGHQFKNSRSHPGSLTCVRCRYRKRWSKM